MANSCEIGCGPRINLGGGGGGRVVSNSKAYFQILRSCGNQEAKASLDRIYHKINMFVEYHFLIDIFC